MRIVIFSSALFSFFTHLPPAHLGEDLKVDLADVQVGVCVQTLQRDRVSLQNWLSWPFDDQRCCMWTDITDD